MKLIDVLKFIIGISCSAVLGCNGDVMTKNDVEKIIHDNLGPGSDNQEIINFFESHGWVYDFDRHVSRYQARNPREEVLPEGQGRNQVYIYVNESGDFVRAEVERVFNGL